MSRILAVCLVLAMASVSLAAVVPPAQLGSWETDMDGWVLENTNVVAIPGMTDGVTLGAGSLGVIVGDGWTGTVKREFGGWWEPTPFTNPTVFTIDVTVIASEWVLGSALGTDGAETHWGIKPLENVVFSGPGSGWWTQFSPVSQPDFSGLGDRNGVWKPEDGDKTVTYTFNLSGVGAVTYEQIILITNSGVTDQRGIIYLDNAYLAPEPATMALLGLGGLALIRRKK